MAIELAYCSDVGSNKAIVRNEEQMKNNPFIVR